MIRANEKSRLGSEGLSNGSSRRPGHWGLGRGAEAELGRGAEAELGRGAEADMGRGAEAELGRGAEAELGRGAEADMGRGAEADMGRGAEADMGRGAEAEMVVLSTGLDQYLQEIFHHLDYQDNGLISHGDFGLLCEVLGLGEDSEDSEEEEEEGGRLLDNLPLELTFRQFHARLCGCFCPKSSDQLGGEGGVGRLAWGKANERVEEWIRSRQQARRRRSHSHNNNNNNRAVSLVPPNKGSGGGSVRSRQRSDPLPTRGGGGGGLQSSGGERCRGAVGAEEEVEETLTLQEENRVLRRLVEELRAALQSGDARCISLEVGLRRHLAPSGSRRGQHPGQAPAALALKWTVKELEMIRGSRDGQVQEAIRLCQELESDLRQAREEAEAATRCSELLRMENAQMRRKAEGARCAMMGCLEQVLRLEREAKRVPELQQKVRDLERNVRRVSSQMGTDSRKVKELQQNHKIENLKCFPHHPPEQSTPTRIDGSSLLLNNKKHFCKAVEGQATSDKENDTWTKYHQFQSSEYKKSLLKFDCCNKGYYEAPAEDRLPHIHEQNDQPEPIVTALEKSTKLTIQLKEEENIEIIKIGQLNSSMIKESQLKSEEAELLRLELQMLETERVRLSLIEEKLTDALQNLQLMRAQNISENCLGQIIVDTLDSCSNSQHDSNHLVEVLDILCQQLESAELLNESSTQHIQTPQSAGNPLMISC